MITIETSIVVATPPSIVRETLLDFPTYPEWNPFITSFESPVPSPPAGTYVKFILGGREIKPVIIENTEKTFNWNGILLGDWFFAGHHFFNFEPHGEVGANGETVETKLVQREVFSGIGVGITMMFMKAKIEEGFNSMNKALKTRAEAKYAERK
jgi:hypothetical protein